MNYLFNLWYYFDLLLIFEVCARNFMIKNGACDLQGDPWVIDVYGGKIAAIRINCGLDSSYGCMHGVYVYFSYFPFHFIIILLFLLLFYSLVLKYYD